MNRREAGGVRDGKGRLFIVATPIGNLEDITLRALRVLGQVDAILAEDTRRTRTLSQYHQIKTPLRAFHAHSSSHSAQGILEELKAGAQLALVSDAGTPLISDPGAHLVSSARESGIIVEAIPGVSAVTAAISVAGVRVDRFRFLGFLPRKGGERAQFLETIRLDSAASVFFESPRRVRPTLLELAEILGDRPVALCRELTKAFEEILSGSARELCEKLPQRLRGEVTIVVSAKSVDSSVPKADVSELIQQLQETPTKQAAQMLSGAAGIPQSDAYKLLIEAKNGLSPANTSDTQSALDEG